ncbi:PIN domain-containing protein [Haloarcula sp. Atlit-7R]|nr:PIN domain-containing protein [Haloarcula sp. Atlit-7R]
MHATVAVETYERLNQSAGFEVRQAAQKDFTNALDLFETYDGLSLGDATIVAYMQRAGVDYLYSFDDDFDVIEDIARLATPDNPFQ